MITFNNDLSACENPPKCPDRGAVHSDTPLEARVYGASLPLSNSLCVSSQWQLDGTTSHSDAHPPHYSVMAVQWANIELWTLNEKTTLALSLLYIYLALRKKKKRKKWPQWQIGIAIMNNYDYDSPKEKSTSSAKAFVDYSDALNY